MELKTAPVYATEEYQVEVLDADYGKRVGRYIAHGRPHASLGEAVAHAELFGGVARIRRIRVDVEPIWFSPPS